MTKSSTLIANQLSRYESELIKDGVVKVDVSSIGTKFENFVQAGCRDLGSHRSRNVYCRKPIILPNLVLFFGTFLELPVLPSITCGTGPLFRTVQFSIPHPKVENISSHNFGSDHPILKIFGFYLEY